MTALWSGELWNGELGNGELDRNHIDERRIESDVYQVSQALWRKWVGGTIGGTTVWIKPRMVNQGRKTNIITHASYAMHSAYKYCFKHTARKIFYLLTYYLLTYSLAQAQKKTNMGSYLWRLDWLFF